MASEDERIDLLISKVMESVPHKSREEILFVLQYYNHDYDTTVDAFSEGLATDLLKKFNYTGSAKSKNRKNRNKKKNKKLAQQLQVAAESAALAPNVPPPQQPEEEEDEEEDSLSELATRSQSLQEILPDSPPVERTGLEQTSQSLPSPKEHTHISNDLPEMLPQPSLNIVTQPPVSNNINNESSNSFLPSTSSAPLAVFPVSNAAEMPLIKVVDNISPEHTIPQPPHKSVENVNKALPPTNSRNRNRSTGSFSQSRTTSISEESSSRPGSQLAGALSSLPAGQGRKILEKSLKDLSRQTVSLQRVNNLLEEELDNSFKRIKSAITEAQTLLEKRHLSLEVEMEKVKKESRQLLSLRKETAAELKQRTERASTMTEAELQELRADIKNFIGDRKYDEELGKTMRFMWDKDRITEEINKFGEIAHVKNSYSQRRQSVSSVGSSTCHTSWSAQEVTNEPTSLGSLVDPLEAGANNLPISIEQHSESKPFSSQVPPFPAARSRVFFNTSARTSQQNSDYNEGGGRNNNNNNRGGSAPPGIDGERGNIQSRSNFRPYPNSNRGGRGGGYQGQDGGRGGYQGNDGGRGRGAPRHMNRGHYNKPHYNNANPHYQQRYGPNPNNEGDDMSAQNQRPPIRRGGRNPRFQNQHYPRHNHNNNNNNTSEGAPLKETQLNGDNAQSKQSNLSNGFDHPDV